MATGPDFGAKCMDCDWSSDGEQSDKAAEKHGKATGHSTRSWMTP